LRAVLTFLMDSCSPRCTRSLSTLTIGLWIYFLSASHALSICCFRLRDVSARAPLFSLTILWAFLSTLTNWGTCCFSKWQFLQDTDSRWGRNVCVAVSMRDNPTRTYWSNYALKKTRWEINTY